MMLLTYAFRKILKRLHKKIQETDGALRVFLQERLESLVIVRTFAKEEQMAQQADDLMDAHKAARMKRSNFSNLCNIGFAGAMDGAYLLGIGFCGYGILTGTMSYGNLMAIMQLVGQVQSPFANLTGYLPRYYSMLASAERLMEAEAFAPDSTETVPEAQALAVLPDRIAVPSAGTRLFYLSAPGADRGRTACHAGGFAGCQPDRPQGRVCSVYRAVRLRQKHPPQAAHVPVSAGFRPEVPFHEKREPTADLSMEKSVCLCSAGQSAFVRFHPQHCCIWG